MQSVSPGDVEAKLADALDEISRLKQELGEAKRIASTRASSHLLSSRSPSVRPRTPPGAKHHLTNPNRSSRQYIRPGTTSSLQHSRSICPTPALRARTTESRTTSRASCVGSRPLSSFREYMESVMPGFQNRDTIDENDASDSEVSQLSANSPEDASAGDITHRTSKQKDLSSQPAQDLTLSVPGSQRNAKIVRPGNTYDESPGSLTPAQPDDNDSEPRDPNLNPHRPDQSSVHLLHTLPSLRTIGELKGKYCQPKDKSMMMPTYNSPINVDRSKLTPSNFETPRSGTWYSNLSPRSHASLRPKPRGMFSREQPEDDLSNRKNVPFFVAKGPVYTPRVMTPGAYPSDWPVFLKNKLAASNPGVIKYLHRTRKIVTKPKTGPPDPSQQRDIEPPKRDTSGAVAGYTGVTKARGYVDGLLTARGVSRIAKLRRQQSRPTTGSVLMGRGALSARISTRKPKKQSNADTTSSWRWASRDPEMPSVPKIPTKNLNAKSSWRWAANKNLGEMTKKPPEESQEVTGRSHAVNKISKNIQSATNKTHIRPSQDKVPMNSELTFAYNTIIPVPDKSFLGHSMRRTEVLAGGAQN